MNTALSSSSQLFSDGQIESCKATVFKIADHWFALPTTAILKVMSLASLGDGALEEGRLALWGGHPLVRLNLHQLLARSIAGRSFEEESSPSDAQKYVLIVWSQTGDRCAILVDELPALVEVPLAEVQLLPPHYRQTISNIAKYMVAVSTKATTMTILLLDLQQALHKGR